MPIFQSNAKVETKIDDENQQKIIDSIPEFLECFDHVEREILNQSNDLYRQYYNELADRRNECDQMLEQINLTLDSLNELNNEYKFVSNKTHSLNSGSEKLISEQNQLSEIADEIKKRLHYFTQSEQILQLLQSPTISVSSELFAQALDRIDKCIAYIREHVGYAHKSVTELKIHFCFFCFFASISE